MRHLKHQWHKSNHSAGLRPTSFNKIDYENAYGSWHPGCSLSVFPCPSGFLDSKCGHTDLHGLMSHVSARSGEHRSVPSGPLTVMVLRLSQSLVSQGFISLGVALYSRFLLEGIPATLSGSTLLWQLSIWLEGPTLNVLKVKARRSNHW